MEEINEEDFHTAVLVFAHFIGIDIENEQHLLYIAEDALGKRGLPAGWELGIGEDANKGIPYFFNTETSQSVWNHPREAVFMRKVKEEKEKDAKKKEKDATKPAKPTPKKPERKVATKTEDRNDKKASSSSGRGEGGADIIEVEDFDDADAVTMLEEDTPKKPVKKSSSNGGFGMSRDDLLKESDTNNRNDSPKPSRPAKNDSSKLAEKKDTWASAGSSGSGAASSRTGGLKSVEGPPVPSRAAKPNRATDNDRPRPNTSSGTTSGSRDRGRDGEPGGRDRPASSAGERGGGAAAGQRPRTSDDRDRVAARDKERERERERTKEQRDKARDREREDELRARDREREREARDRDREKERERERERDMGKEIDSRVAAERRRTDEERRRALHFEDEVEVMRDKLRDMEGTVAEERERRRKIEEKLTSAQGDYDSRLRDTVDSWEERLRRTRDEVETDMREKMKNVERRAADDVEEARAELKTAKAKQAEAEREAETMRRKMGMSKEDGKAEAHEEMTRLRVELETAGDVQRVHATEMRHLREENVELGSKLASALQASQVAVAEAEMAKAQASNIVAEGQSSHTALVQATNRIQELDTELARMKGELLLQKKEAEAAQNEMAKLRGKEGSHTEKINLAEAEVRKARVGAQTEVMRLQSRVQELEQTNDIITQQLDNAGTDQTKAVRDVERTLDKALFDMTRVQDNLRAEEAKSEAGVQRIIALEKQLLQQQDVVYKREREVKEHQAKSEQAEARVDEVAQSFAKEAKAAQAELADAKKALQALQIAHQKEIDAIKAEVQQKLPELSAQAAAHMEKQFQQRLEDEATSIRRRFELSEERYKREILDVQTAYAEREARSRVAVADDRAELEHVKAQNGKLQRQVEELEAQTDELQQTMKAKSRALLLADKERYIQAVDASVEGLPPPPSHHHLSHMQQQQQQQHSLDRDDSQVTDKAVMELQQQLAMMKGQLGAALERTMNTESRAAHVPFSITKSAYSAHRPNQQVTFSPESLFMSPDAKSVAAALSAGDTIRPEKSAVRFASEGGGDYMDGGDGGGMQDFTYMQSPAPNNKSAVDRSYAAYGDAAAVPMPTQPTAAATDYAQSEAKEGPTSSAGAGADENDIGIDDPQFDGIQDGGFHEGYWKARYHKTKAQSSTQGYR